MRLRPWLGLLLLLSAAAAPASTVVPLNVTQLTDGARRIFLGTCVGARPDTLGGAIVTRFDFVVDTPLKGVTDDTLRVALPGGEFAGIRESIAGVPAFTAGDEVVLFLTAADRHGRAWPVGLAQGGFYVRRAPGRAPRVRRDFDALRFEGASARGAGLPATDMPLSELLEDIPAKEVPEEIAASHVLISYKGAERSEAERSKEEAEALAAEVLQKARAEGADFAELASQHSDGPTKDKGGDLGTFKKGTMAPAFEEAAFALEVGEISDVVETPFGFHIIKRTE